MRAALLLFLVLPSVVRADSLQVGLNYPWFIEHGQGVGLFGEMTRDQRTAVRAHLSDMAGAGIRVLRVFTLAHAARWPERVDGRFQPLPAQYVEDLRWFVREAHARGIDVMPVLWDFHLDDTHADWIDDPKALPDLLDQVVEPLVRALSGEPGLVAWDVMNEPEWIMNAPVLEIPGSPLLAGLSGLAGRIETCVGAFLPGSGPKHSPERVKAWLQAQVERIHAAGGRTTLGAVSPLTVHFWKGIGLDEYQVHYYPVPGMQILGNAQFDLLPAVDALDLDAPCFLGEFPANAPGVDLAEVLDCVQRLGYTRALAWSYFGAGDPEDLSHSFSFHARRADFQHVTTIAHGAAPQTDPDPEQDLQRAQGDVRVLGVSSEHRDGEGASPRSGEKVSE